MGKLVEEQVKGIVGCCAGGSYRHEVCSHVKNYIKQLETALLKRLLEQKQQFIEVLEETPRGTAQRYVEAIPTSIIEAELKELKK